MYFCIHLSCLASGFKKGDEVIVPSQTHAATAHAVEYTGAKARLVDIDLYSGNININEIKKALNKKTKGIIVVHMAGYSCDLDVIIKLCKEKKITLIEDCAHALGTTYKKKHVGNFGISGCFSFYPTKQITTGEGGALITNNKKLYLKIKKLKAFGINKDINQRKIPGKYDVVNLGYNFRMTDFQAALGYYQLKRYRYNLLRRKEIAKRYLNNFKLNKRVKICLTIKFVHFLFFKFLKKIEKI